MAKLFSAKFEIGEELERDPGDFVPPIFENRLAGTKELFTDLGTEPRNPREQNDGVASSPGDRNRVQLEVSEPADDLERPIPMGPLPAAFGGRREEPRLEQGKAPSFKG